jgi:hypothetical protein
MITKQEILNKLPTFAEGLKVRSRDEENLGKVVDVGDNFFGIEKGIFFPQNFYARYEDIADIRDGVLYLNVSKDELSNWRSESYAGWNQADQINAG